MTRIEQRTGLSRRGLGGAALSGLALAIPGVGRARHSHDTAALSGDLQRLLDQILPLSGAHGATAAVALASGQVLEFAAGLSDAELGLPMAPDSRMPAGSIGKTFLAALAAALAEEGAIDLDASIARYTGKAPWFAEVPAGKDITLRMLLNQTAGIAEWFANLPPDMTREQIAQLLSPGHTMVDCMKYAFAAPPVSRPGERYAYSDANYILASLVIEAATGEPFGEQIVRRFLYPLQLRHTGLADSRMQPGLAQGYLTVEDNPLLKFYGPVGATVPVLNPPGILQLNPRFEGAGGGFTSTAHDLAVWAKTLYENRAFHGDYLKTALASLGPQSAETVKIGPMGLGMFVWDPDAGYELASRVSGKQYGFLGVFPGYSSAMLYFPKSRMSVAMMFNGGVSKPLRHQFPTRLADLATLALA